MPRRGGCQAGAAAESNLRGMGVNYRGSALLQTDLTAAPPGVESTLLQSASKAVKSRTTAPRPGEESKCRRQERTWLPCRVAPPRGQHRREPMQVTRIARVCGHLPLCMKPSVRGQHMLWPLTRCVHCLPQISDVSILKSDKRRVKAFTSFRKQLLIRSCRSKEMCKCARHSGAEVGMPRHLQGRGTNCTGVDNVVNP